MTPAQEQVRRPMGPMIVSALVGLAAGYVVLEVVVATIDVVWLKVPERWSSTPLPYIFGIPLAAAVLVYLSRRFLSDAGHSPLHGFAVHSLSGREYIGVMAAIVAGLAGGVVLGPEVALVSTGAAIGTVIARRSAQPQPIVRAGVAGAVLALFIGPIASGSLNLGQQSLEVDQLAWALPVAAVTALVVSLARWGGALIARVAGGPHLIVLLAGAAVIAGAAATTQALTGESVAYVLTSGEELITELPTITSLSTVLIILLTKAIAYSVSLGAGFRGGPFFPAMFLGATVGLGAALLLPSGPSTAAAISVGVIAGIVATMRLSWKAVIILGVVVGYVMGGWGLIAAAVVGALVARVIPRWEDKAMPDRGTNDRVANIQPDSSSPSV